MNCERCNSLIYEGTEILNGFCLACLKEIREEEKETNESKEGF